MDERPASRQEGESGKDWLHIKSFVSDVYLRYLENPESYRSFFHILESFCENKKSFEELYTEVCSLFVGHSDLFEAFKTIFPGTNLDRTKQYVSNALFEVEAIKKSSRGTVNTENPNSSYITYKSTRGGESGLSFETVLFSAYAKDGGLYVPETLPSISNDELLKWRNMSYPDICSQILHLFTDIRLDHLADMTSKAFSRFNPGKEPLQMTKIGDDKENLILLDAACGPTLAFKDIGQQIVGQLLSYYSKRSGKRANIMVDTSGDTGPAAIDAVRGLDNLDITVLYPNERVSPFQELQMITAVDPNVHIYRTEGNNDDQSTILKSIFSDQDFVRKNQIVSINSINWARILAQSTYYFWAYLQIYNTSLSIGQPVDFAIPSGAFGNGAGALIAKKMGLPIGRILCATNVNDVVHRTISLGDMRMLENHATKSPAMDIQYAYNLERLVYYMCNDSSYVKAVMEEVENCSDKGSGHKAKLNRSTIDNIQQLFSSVSVTDDKVLATISKVYREDGFALCPHSAIGVYGARSLHRESGIWSSANPMVCVLTAHPSKFSDTFVEATGAQPPICSWSSLEKLQSRQQRFKWLRKPREEEDLQDWQSHWIATLKNDIKARS